MHSHSWPDPNNYHRSYYTTIATKSGTDWYLYRAEDYDIIGSNSGSIVTNHGGVSGAGALATTTLNFTSAGTLYVSTGDTINIKAISGAVELQDDTTPTTVSPYWAGWGTVNLVGGSDTVNVVGYDLKVHGGGGDNIRMEDFKKQFVRHKQIGLAFLMCSLGWKITNVCSERYLELCST